MVYCTFYTFAIVNILLGVVPSGTYRFCIVNKPKFDDEGKYIMCI